MITGKLCHNPLCSELGENTTYRCEVRCVYVAQFGLD